MPDLIFKMEHQFTLYLQRCGVTRAQLPPDQYREMRRAFYGGLAQMFFLITQDVAKLTQHDTIKTLKSITEQLGAFWTEEVENQDRGVQEIHPTSAVKCPCGWGGQVKDLKTPEKKGLAACPKCGSEQLFFKL